ncbi:MAG: NADH-quinone oxidoreductase subunit L [Anaerolineales bacterium]
MWLSEAVSSGPQFFYLVPLVVLFPVIGLLVNTAFGGRMSEKAIGWLASAAAGLSFVVAVLLGISLLSYPEGAVVPIVDWITIGELNINWGFQVDTLSVTMMLVVAGVGTLIHIYSVGYMHDDVRFQGDPGRYQRFFVFMNLFIAMMMILVSADNYLMLFVGWEGVGLCSYLLIGFWYDKGENGIGNAVAGKKAFIANRIGDFGFILSAFIMFWVFGTFEFNAVFELAPEVASLFPAAIVAITLLMLVGVTGKSAQIPLFVWLPDAMAGPTPVSALIHAATMVTAGVYLITRSAALYNLVPQVQNTVALVGAATALFAATIAVGQFDIKKVLAYSTISQLGFMVAAVGMGAYVAGMFHLVTHAFFKALLFLSAGSVILGLEHAHHHMEHNSQLKLPMDENDLHFDPQDMRNMGGLRNRMKISFWVYLIGAIALTGIPPLAGFWSKDEILTDAANFNPLAYWMMLAAAFLTAFYMGRQILMVWFGKPRSLPAEHANESPPIITVPLIILAALAATGGALNLPMWHTFTHWLEDSLGHLHAVEFSLQIAGVSSFLVLAAIFLAWLLYGRKYQAMQELPPDKRPDDPLRPILGPVFTALNHAWWMDELYWTIIINPYVSLAHFLADVVDWRFWHDWFHDTVIVGGYNKLTQVLSIQIDLGVIDAVANKLGDSVKRTAAKWRVIETGYVRNYALSFFIGVVLILGYLILR